MSKVQIVPFSPEHTDAIVEVTASAWAPVFLKTETQVPRFVYDAFYPDGWEVRQKAEVLELLTGEPENIWVALIGSQVAGYLGVRFHPEDQMGEIYIIAVAPAFQRRGIGQSMMRFAEAQVKAAGMKMIMVETIGDEGHAPARRAYKAFGFRPWPVARYFKPI